MPKGVPDPFSSVALFPLLILVSESVRQFPLELLNRPDLSSTWGRKILFFSGPDFPIPIM